MSFLIKIVLALIINTVLLNAQSQEEFTISVTVNNIESNEGSVFLALYNGEETFLKTHFKGGKSEIKNKKCQITFKDIPQGIYAISVFHDENNNGKMDTNFMGIPKEDYGCSNNAKGFMGPPEWKDAKFELKNNKTINIKL